MSVVYLPRSPGALYVQRNIGRFMQEHPRFSYSQSKHILLLRYIRLDEETMLHYHQESENLYEQLKQQNPIVESNVDLQVKDLSLQLSGLCDDNETDTVKTKLQRYLSHMLVALTEMPNNDAVFSCEQIEDLYGDFHVLAHCLKKIIEQIEPEYFFEHDDARETALTENKDLV